MPDIVAPIIPNVRGDPEIFVNAFQRALALSLANRKQQQQLEFQNRRLLEQTALGEQKLEMEDRYHQVMAGVASDRIAQGEERISQLKDRLDLEKDKTEFQKDRFGRDTEKLADFQKELGGINAEPGTQEWEHQANLIRSKFGQVTWSTAGERIWKDSFQAHKATANEMAKSAAQVELDYHRSLQDKNVRGSWLADPGEWGTNKKDGSRFVYFDPNTGNRVPDNTPGSVARTISATEYDTLRKQQNRVLELRSSDSNQPARQNKVDDAPTSPASRIAGTIYKTPRGPMKWTGTGWTAP